MLPNNYKHPAHQPSVRWALGAPSNKISEPQEPWVLDLLKQYNLRCKVVEGGYDLINSHGDAVLLTFDARPDDWVTAAKELEAYRAAAG